MNTGTLERFVMLWEKYFPGAGLPVTFELIDSGTEREDAERLPPSKNWRCIICDLAKVRKGKTLILGNDSVSCGGGRFFTGYEKERFPDFRYFLSCGKPGFMEGERYKIDPETVDEAIKSDRHIPIEGKEYLFKRWDMLGPADNPEVVIFFAKGEILSGLFTLANFDRGDPFGGVVCPFGSGCCTVIYYPWFEQQSENPRAVLGMFDPSARPCVPADELTFAVPMNMFEKMISYMEESFLTTPAWDKVKRKIAREMKAKS
ncbi:DUF169 domain-containing protein [Methanolacinia petrolearia]|uniref:DUF169 domain-containing protein n=1 Tax=Methanolacinia petrolearia TaxID=54120 RepID=UPI003BABFCB7